MERKYIKMGLTGGLGTGKSTVAGMFQELGAAVVDADVLAHRLLQRGTEQYRQVVRRFGNKILDRRGRIRRRVLAREVFGHPRRLACLNRIIHPPVIRILKNKLKRGKAPLRIGVVPLLYEAGLENWFDLVVVVEASPETVGRRLGPSRKMKPEEIRRRVISQLSLEEKIRRADFVIDNDGSLSRSRKQVRAVWDKLIGNRKGFRIDSNKVFREECN